MIWKKSSYPIIALAPLAGYTDSAFRQICREFKADIVYGEMASAAALAREQEKTFELLKFSPKERPYIVQLFGNKPDDFARAAQVVSRKIKPDGIDINFGCPVPKVAKQGAGAALMKDLKLSREIIKAVIDNTSLPVSIKTRTQVGKINILDFLDNISDLDIKAVMIHGRTLKQGFVGPIDCEIIKKARHHFNGIILANGGINSLDEAKKVLAQSEADGLGIGRGALGNPWIFEELRRGLKNNNYKIKSKNLKFIKKIALQHAKLTYKTKGEAGIIELRKHLSWYIHGLPNSRELRGKLVKVETLEDVKKALNTL